LNGGAALRLDPRGIKALRSWLDRFWESAIAFKEAAERETATEMKSTKAKKKGGINQDPANEIPQYRRQSGTRQIGKANAVDAVIESRIGVGWYEHGDDGSTPKQR
jgi:hypothetical protein